jgi:hypothetical protein
VVLAGRCDQATVFLRTWRWASPYLLDTNNRSTECGVAVWSLGTSSSAIPTSTHGVCVPKCSLRITTMIESAGVATPMVRNVNIHPSVGLDDAAATQLTG